MHDSDGTVAPRWSAREAAAVIQGMRAMGRKSPGGFPLWYQFAAVAYGWEPDTDRLDASETQAATDYPADQSVQLNLELQRIAMDLDAAAVPDPRIELDDVFFDPSWQAEVKQALRQDGARAEWKIPLPACKDPVTGKPTGPTRDPQTGKWTCPGGAVTIDDPLTALLKALSTVAVPAVIVLIAYAAITHKRPRRGKR